MAEAPDPPAPWLVPEVVEEPELIEVHQADPRLAEDLELPLPEPGPEDDPELRRGLMRVVLS